MKRELKRRIFGQHFLIDSGVVQTIVDTALEGVRETSSENLLEIGPGMGAITHPLLKQLSDTPMMVQNFLLIEKDQKIASEWKNQSSRWTSEVILHVIENDFLDVPTDDWLTDRLYVVSNLPYSTGTRILLRLAEFPDRIQGMTLMFQAEVANRLLSGPSTPDRGSLTVWIQNLWDVQKVIRVLPKSFRPRPKVDSLVVTLTPRSEPRIPASLGAMKDWDLLLRKCFSQRRKMLKGILKTLPQGSEFLQASGIDGTLRAEALDWPEWNALFNAYLKHVPR